MNGSRTFGLAAGVWALASGVAFAADMPPLLEQAPVIEEFSGWYLRGDVGMTNQQADRLDFYKMHDGSTYNWLDEGKFDSGWLFGLGVGYQFNSWLRADITGEYRGRTSFRALDRYDENGDGTWDGTNDYSLTKSEWLFLANAYVDLGTWWGVTPFIGAGIGVVDIMVDNYRDLGWNNGVYNTAYAEPGDKWNFAWALHAGLAYHVSPAFTVELAYRYLNMGDAKTGFAYAWGGYTSSHNVTVESLESHDLKLAMRWALGAPEAVPVVRKY